ncbi:hypothetical protein [Sphingosinicella humi]|uniref:Uncharacterized protein n=1 Tax=Allosphingosinicella humi TaxID=2068657 RepID=A0A2U2J3W5_9SPHN|nr:hypothetical protein [Sphingosinicella humi]PWG03018.1 hypothetical protein DF286_09165 [Sphingosinicella humi]
MDPWLTRLNIQNFERRLSRSSNPAQKRVLRQLLAEERSKLARCGDGDSGEEASIQAPGIGESATDL